MGGHDANQILSPLLTASLPLLLGLAPVTKQGNPLWNGKPPNLPTTGYRMLAFCPAIWGGEERIRLDSESTFLVIYVCLQPDLNVIESRILPWIRL